MTELGDYDYWNAKLAGEDPDPPTDRTQLPCGFWRLQNNGCLAVWVDGDERIALRDGKLMSHDAMERMAEMGGFGRAVTQERYDEFRDKSHWWDDPPPSGVGGNLPIDPNERLILELQSELENIAPELKTPVDSQEKADRIATWARKIGQLEGAAEAARKAEKQPHLDAGRAVDERWNPVIGPAKEIVQLAKAAVDVWLKKLQREEEARQRAVALKVAEIAAEKAAAEKAGKPTEAYEYLETKAAAEMKARPVQVGRKGFKVSLRKVDVAVIVDFPAALAAVASSPEVHEVVQKLADRACRAKIPMQGVEFRTEERAV